LFVAAAGILANGLLATIEDELPGGFNNPDGDTATPRYLRRVGYIARWTLGVLSCLTAIALVVFPSPGVPTTATVVLIAVGIFLIGIGLIARSKPIQIAALALLTISIGAAIVQQPAARP
jgi:hypothetical protein